ncbi:MAG: M23 family metallopeptidase [Ginsengibacter sp.]|jgi:murein DD-endopeptidase MepM/ murein hydrolase activator NlpD
MKKRKEKTTILLVNKNQQGIKPIQISTRLILNWKKYVGAIVLLFFTLIAGIGYLANDAIRQIEMQANLSAKINNMHVLFAEVDTVAIREKFNNIDKELIIINKYLETRGVKPVFKDAHGGIVDNDILSTVEISTFYEKYLKKISNSLSHIPLGMPFTGKITSSFGHRENPFGGYGVETHRGMDIKGPMGAPVKSMAKGKVVFSGIKGGYGNCIILEHGSGFETLYGHLSKVTVRSGQKIDIGQQIGNIGSTGRSTGPHLHYEVHQNGKRINPISFLTLD